MSLFYVWCVLSLGDLLNITLTTQVRKIFVLKILNIRNFHLAHIHSFPRV